MAVDVHGPAGPPSRRDRGASRRRRGVHHVVHPLEACLRSPRSLIGRLLAAVSSCRLVVPSRRAVARPERRLGRRGERRAVGATGRLDQRELRRPSRAPRRPRQGGAVRGALPADARGGPPRPHAAPGQPRSAPTCGSRTAAVTRRHPTGPVTAAAWPSSGTSPAGGTTDLHDTVASHVLRPDTRGPAHVQRHAPRRSRDRRARPTSSASVPTWPSIPRHPRRHRGDDPSDPGELRHAGLPHAAHVRLGRSGRHRSLRPLPPRPRQRRGHAERRRGGGPSVRLPPP